MTCALRWIALPVALMLLAAVALAQEAENLGAVNGAFEGDEDGNGIADGWEYTPGGDPAQLDVTFALEPGREGGTAQKIECARYAGGHAMLAQVGTVTVEQGAWYRVTLWARAEGSPNVGVAIHDTDGWRQCGLWQTFRPAERWRRYTWRFQGDHDCHETSRLQIWFSSVGTLWVDDLVLERIEAPPQANVIDDIGSKNLVPNSSFECGPDRWVSDGCWRLFGEVVETEAVHGSCAMQVAWSRADAPVFSFDYYEMQRTPYAVPAITSAGWMRVRAGESYVLSMYLRADRPVANARLRAFGPTRQQGGARIGLTTDWQRFEVPFTTTEDLCYVQVDVDCNEAGLDELTYWVDAVQLEAGESATDYEPRRPLEIGVAPRNGTGIFVGSETPVVELVAANYGDQPVDLQLTVAATDGFDRPVRTEQPLLRVPPGRLPGRIDGVSLGAFSRVTVTSGLTDPRVVRIARIAEIDGPDSRFGINHAYEWDPILTLARGLGITWARDWSLKWDHVEPEPGRFDFAMADYQIDRPRALGMNVLCMFPFPSASWSTTAPALEEIPEELRARAANRIRTAYAPRDPAELENYVYESVMHYRDRIKVWEVFNESIFTSYSLPRRAGYQALDYLPLLQAAHRGCKRADPGCTVIGGYSVPPQSFDELHGPFIAAGGLQYCDAYSLHIYPGGDPEFIGPQLDRITAAMRAAGGVKPMWMTEYAYYADDDPDPVTLTWPTLVESELVQAQRNTRMCVLQLAHGVERIFYHIWTTRANRDSSARIFFEYAGAPRKIAVSQAAMADILGPQPRFLRALDAGEDASCYLFRTRGEELVAVAWHHWDRQPLGPLADVQAFDLFGTPLALEGLELTEAPVYLVGRAPAEDFAAALGEALTP